MSFSRLLLPFTDAVTEDVQKKAVLKIFAKSPRNHLCRNFFLEKVTSLQPTTPAHVFYCEFYQVFKSAYFTEHIWVAASFL